MMKKWICLAFGLMTVSPSPRASADLPAWALGPFTRPENAQPVMTPKADSTFDCPMRGQAIAWEALHTFNPAATVKDGQIQLLYRAEDATGEMKVGGHTSRIGLATSDNGIDFDRRPTPVLYPADDSQRPHEWDGGCEDPRIAQAADGTWVLTYTQYNKKTFRIGIATSQDLLTWNKLGSPFRGTRYENLKIKSASIVQEVRDGKLVAAKIDGKFWMYFGERSVNVAWSEDLTHWHPVETEPGKLLHLIRPRPGHFDSDLTEVGPSVVKTKDGIVLVYNGRNSTGSTRDKSLQGGVYACGQILFDGNDPTKVLDRLDTPFFQPALAWERTGQYGAGTTFAEGLVYKDGTWFLYYGCADSFVGVAMAEAKPSEIGE